MTEEPSRTRFWLSVANSKYITALPLRMNNIPHNLPPLPLQQVSARSFGFMLSFWLLLLIFVVPVSGATRYVALTGGHIPPYDSWANASTNLACAALLMEEPDTLLVATGSYTMVHGPCTNSVIRGTWVGEAGPEFTTLDFSGLSDSVSMGMSSSLRGFTVRDFHSQIPHQPFTPAPTGAIVLNGGTISDCHFTNNRVEQGKGGAVSGSGLIEDCVFESNAANIGGAVFVLPAGTENDRWLTILRSRFVLNEGLHGVGAIDATTCLSSTNLALESCDFVDNYTLLGGTACLEGPFDSIFCGFSGHQVHTNEHSQGQYLAEPFIVSGSGTLLSSLQETVIAGNCLPLVKDVRMDGFQVRSNRCGYLLMQSSELRDGIIADNTAGLVLDNCTVFRCRILENTSSTTAYGCRLSNCYLFNNSGNICADSGVLIFTTLAYNNAMGIFSGAATNSVICGSNPTNPHMPGLHNLVFQAQNCVVDGLEVMNNYINHGKLNQFYDIYTSEVRECDVRAFRSTSPSAAIDSCILGQGSLLGVTPEDAIDLYGNVRMPGQPIDLGCRQFSLPVAPVPASVIVKVPPRVSLGAGVDVTPRFEGHIQDVSCRIETPGGETLDGFSFNAQETGRYTCVVTAVHQGGAVTGRGWIEVRNPRKIVATTNELEMVDTHDVVITNLVRAIELAVPGERVEVRGGDYDAADLPDSMLDDGCSICVPDQVVVCAETSLIRPVLKRHPVKALLQLNNRSIISDFRIFGHPASNDAGALIEARESSILSNLIIEDTGHNSGASIVAGGVTLNSTFRRCAGQFSGGVFKKCIFYDNTAPFAFNFTTLKSCLIARNYFFWAGGHVPDFLNCTIVNNHGVGTMTSWPGTRLVNTVISHNYDSSAASLEFGLVQNSYVSTNEYHNESSNVFVFDLPPDIDPQYLMLLDGLGDYRLRPDSGLVDMGVMIDELVQSEDLAGRPRIGNQRVDIGAYEFYFDGGIRARLQGPLSAISGLMSTNAPVALQSPYASDPRVAATIATNTVDWVLLELYSQTNQPPVFARSVLLRDDGQLTTEDGHAVVPIDVTPMTNYWVAVKHRGHLASVTASAIPFTNNVVEVDFTVGSAAYLGGTNTAVQVGTHWAARAGDVDGDGVITALDQTMAGSQSGSPGNQRGDLNRDGTVDALDDALIAGNLGSTSGSFDTALSPALVISPDRRTLVSGESLPLMSDGSAATRWAYVRNQTGSSLSTTNGPSATYTAGPTHGQVDVIQAWDPVDGRVGRTYLNVISPAEVNALGKAVILAGGRSLDDPVWPATDYLSAKAHNALRYRGYSQANLLHLNFHPGRDLDGDGLANDIDGSATLATAQQAFTSFIDDASQVFIYLVDHGATVQSNGLFRLNQNEFLSAQDLDNWLDSFQDARNQDVVVVLDFCFAGAFAQQLEYTGPARRIILSATQPGQPTYFIAGGQVSYSEYFWNGVYQGLTLGRAHGLAAGVMNPYQQGWLDDDANGVGNGSDGALAAVRTVGASFVAGKSYPVIERALDGQALAGTTEATLWVDLVNSAYPVDRLWCTITPPNYNVNPNTGVPVVDIPVRDLTRNPVSGRWEFDYDGFTQEGPYIVNFFARDIWSSVSPPKTVTIDQRGFDERVILVAGGPTNGVHWAATREIARNIRATLASRLVSTNDLQFLSAEAFDDFGHPGTNQVDRLATRAQLQQAFQNPVVQSGVDGSNKLTVWFVGSAADGRFRLNDSETLSAADLNGWLGHYQRNGAKAQVILDFDGAGAWLGTLQAPSNRERILLAGSEANRAALLRSDLGLSAVVCSGLNQGQTLGAAADRARKVVRRASGNLRQKVLIEDNGNGVANEKDIDGRVAAQRYVGSAFVTGEDRPVIGSVLPEQVVTNGQSVLLWAAEVSDATGVSNVWVNVTSPGNWVDALTTRLDLVYEEASGRWEAESLPFDQAGVHIVGFQAMDIHSNLSEVVQSRILVEEANQTTRRLPNLPDPFEPDGLCEAAPIIDLPLIQTRSLHASNDCDAVLFFAQSNLVYDIETVHLTNTVDTVIEIHRVFTNGTTVLVDRIDEFGTDEGELGGLDYPDEGLYCVRVCHADGTPFEPGSYVLVIHVPAGFTGINVTARNLATQGALVGSVARLYSVGGSELDSATVGTSGVVKFTAPVGNYRVSVTAPSGYAGAFDTANSNNVPENPNSSYGNYRNLPSSGFGTVTYGVDAGSTAAYLGYYFFPGVSVTGTVVSAITHEPMGDVGISVRRTSDNTVFDRYPWAAYGTLWKTRTDAGFPSRVILPSGAGFSLTLSKPGFTNGVAAISTPVNGVLNLGRLTLGATDSDGDGLPDAWETAMFGNLAQTATSNPDGDAFTTEQEFQAGTHPNQGGSELKLVEPTITGDTLTLTWPAVATRKYNIRSAATLDGDWTTEDLVSNPPVISGGMAIWTTPAPPDRRYYQIETVFLP